MKMVDACHPLVVAAVFTSLAALRISTRRNCSSTEAAFRVITSASSMRLVVIKIRAPEEKLISDSCRLVCALSRSFAACALCALRSYNVPKFFLHMATLADEVPNIRV